MLCPQCGKKAPPGARFCPQCGTVLPAEAPPEVTTPAGAGVSVPVAAVPEGSSPAEAAHRPPEPPGAGQAGKGGEEAAAAESRVPAAAAGPSPATPPGNVTAPAGGVSAGSLFFRTLPYVFLRIGVYLLFGVILIAFLAVMGGIGYFIARHFQGAGLPLVVVVGLVAVMGAWALTVLAQRYFLYLVKIGHVAVITEIVTKGDLPPGTSQVGYGKEKVLKHFGTASTLFVVDALVAGAVRQVLNWLTRLAGCLGGIPGLNLVIGLLRRILGLAGNYIDEAVMGYVLTHEEQSIYQAACDGVVLYAQSWRQLLGTATWCVLVVAAVWVVSFLALLFPLLGVARSLTPVPGLQALYGLVALLAAIVFAGMIKWIVADPLATVAMVASYHRAIARQVPAHDLRATLSSISGKFRRLAQKAVAPAPEGGARQ